MGADPKPLRIAVLVNTPPANRDFWLDVRMAWTEALAAAAAVDLYDPVDERALPDASAYDLVVLSGGKADASGSDPWVLAVLDYVQATVRRAPGTKILGVCWGHQAVSRALGGSVRAVPSGPIAAIQDIKLTEAGKSFFPFAAAAGQYRAPEFHVREVAAPPPDFVPLAEGHECFVNAANTVLTFQAHPELSHELARKLLLEEDPEYNGGLSGEQVARELRRLDEEPTDGARLMQRVLQWVRE